MKEFSIYFSEIGIKQIKPTGTINLTDCANLIRTGENLIKMTNELRAIPADDTEARRIKKSLLPYATFAGTFTKRAAKNLIERSEYFVVDLDHVRNQDQIKANICKFFIPAMLFVSPSGDGLKVVFQIDPDAGTHLDFFNAFKHFFKKEISVDIDEACKDICRATFLCHDENVYLSDNPDILDQEFIFSVPEPAVVATDEAARYNGAKDWTDKQVTFTEGSRNKYITTLAACCHRFGLSEQFVTHELETFAENGFSIQEIQSTIKSIYNNTAYSSIAETENCPYIRVGTDFLKIAYLPTGIHNLLQYNLLPWNKETILQDHKRNQKYLNKIPKYDAFIMKPDNINHQQVIDGKYYNQYAPFQHTPAPGEWIWTRRLLEHIFGEQYDLGIRYMQILYQNPTWLAPILVLVSAENNTGKTTFLNWISMIFGANSVFVGSKSFESNFNHAYSTMNIIMIDETMFEREITIEKLKAYSTAKRVLVNKKNVSEHTIDFYGKIILASNNEKKFAKIHHKETRFFVRKLNKPKFRNITIEKDLLVEIPSFLYYLNTLPPVPDNISRNGFTAEELRNTTLIEAIEANRPALYSDIKILVEEYFISKPDLKEFFASASDIKERFYKYENKWERKYIREILTDSFELTKSYGRYHPFDDSLTPDSIGNYFLFKREDFCDGEITDEKTPF